MFIAYVRPGILVLQKCITKPRSLLLYKAPKELLIVLNINHAPPYAWYDERTTEKPHGNTYYPPASTYSTQPPFSTPFGPQLSYPYRPQSSGFQRCNSQASMGHYPE